MLWILLMAPLSRVLPCRPVWPGSGGLGRTTGGSDLPAPTGTLVGTVAASREVAAGASRRRRERPGSKADLVPPGLQRIAQAPSRSASYAYGHSVWCGPFQLVFVAGKVDPVVPGSSSSWRIECRTRSALPRQPLQQVPTMSRSWSAAARSQLPRGVTSRSAPAG